jgi:hypothetical protein
MDGIAEGAKVDPREILVINIRTGLIRMIEEASTEEDHECTTVSVVPPATADGHTLMGQNWDQNAGCQPNTVLIEQRIAGQPALLFITEAGILFRHGMNDAGLGTVGNALRTDREARADSGLTSHFSRRRALRETNFANALRALTSVPQSHSGNHMLASAGSSEAVDVETVPGEAFHLHPENGILVHSNHLLHPDAQRTIDDHVPLGYFLETEPVAMAGYTIYIYHLTATEADRIRAQLGLPGVRDRHSGCVGALLVIARPDTKCSPRRVCFPQIPAPRYRRFVDRGITVMSERIIR